MLKGVMSAGRSIRSDINDCWRGWWPDLCSEAKTKKMLQGDDFRRLTAAAGSG